MLISLLMILMAIASFIHSTNRPAVESRLAAVGILFTLTVLISINRPFEMGADTLGYIDKYYDLKFIPLEHVLAASWDSDAKDPAFYITAKIFGDLGWEARTWIGMLSLLFLLSFTWLTWKESHDPAISFVMLIGLGYLFFSYTGLRQALSLTLIFLAARSFLHRRAISFFTLILIAALFHKSAIVFALLWPIRNLQLKLLHAAILATGAVALAQLFPEAIRQLVFDQRLVEYELYRQFDSTLNATGFIVYAILLLIAIRYRDAHPTQSNNSLITMAAIGVVFQAMSLVVAEFFRLAMYFNAAFFILVPNAIASIPSTRVRHVASVGASLFFLAMALASKNYNDLDTIINWL